MCIYFPETCQSEYPVFSLRNNDFLHVWASASWNLFPHAKSLNIMSLKENIFNCFGQLWVCGEKEEILGSKIKNKPERDQTDK